MEGLLPLSPWYRHPPVSSKLRKQRPTNTAKFSPPPAQKNETLFCDLLSEQSLFRKENAQSFDLLFPLWVCARPPLVWPLRFPSCVRQSDPHHLDWHSHLDLPPILHGPTNAETTAPTTNNKSQHPRFVFECCFLTFTCIPILSLSQSAPDLENPEDINQTNKQIISVKCSNIRRWCEGIAGGWNQQGEEQKEQESSKDSVVERECANSCQCQFSLSSKFYLFILFVEQKNWRFLKKDVERWMNEWMNNSLTNLLPLYKLWSASFLLLWRILFFCFVHFKKTTTRRGPSEM